MRLEQRRLLIALLCEFGDFTVAAAAFFATARAVSSAVAVAISLTVIGTIAIANALSPQAAHCGGATNITVTFGPPGACLLWVMRLVRKVTKASVVRVVRQRAPVLD
jgi:hypothetical protein